jgi:DNA-directed RNA polymerase alpha subunit
MSLFTEHLKDCSPLAPCYNCEVVRFLQNRLSEADFTALEKLMEKALKHRAPVEESIDVLNLSARGSNCLRAENINTVGELIAMTEGQLLRTPNIGRITVRLIKEALESRGLHLK